MKSVTFWNPMDNTDDLDDGGRATGIDLNQLLCTYQDNPNNELRIYTDSPYMLTESVLPFLIQRKRQFTVLSLNIQSINSKFNLLTAFLSHLDANNVNSSAICLQGTWLSSEQDVSIFMIPGYHLIHSGKSAGNCGGLFIYLRDKYSFTSTGQHNQSDLWEGLSIEVQGKSLEGKLTICNIYRPQNIIMIMLPLDDLLMKLVLYWQAWERKVQMPLLRAISTLIFVKLMKDISIRKISMSLLRMVFSLSLLCQLESASIVVPWSTSYSVN